MKRIIILITLMAAISANGPSLAIKCSDTKNCRLNLWVDKEMTPEADRKFMVGVKDTAGRKDI